jgi:hypothetical protein
LIRTCQKRQLTRVEVTLEAIGKVEAGIVGARLTKGI